MGRGFHISAHQLRFEATWLLSPTWFTREILANFLDNRATKSLVIRALRQALALHQRQDPYFEPAGVIHHSDAGLQYTSTDLRRLLAVHQMDASIGTVGDA